MNAESPSSILGCDHGDCCLSNTVGWRAAGLLVEPDLLHPILEFTSQTMPQALLQTALTEQEGAPQAAEQHCPTERTDEQLSAPGRTLPTGLLMIQN